MVKRAKIVVLSIFLILVPVLKGVAIPTSLKPHAIYPFVLEIGKYWVENVERLIGATVGIF